MKTNVYSKLGKNFIFLYSSNVISTLIGFLIITYIARAIGVESYGKVIFSLSIASYFFILAEFGTGTIGTREFAKNSKFDMFIFKNIIFIRVLLSLICYFLLIAFVSVVNFSKDIKIMIIIYGITVFANVFFIEWVFKGIDKMQMVAISRFINKIVYGLIIIIMFNLFFVNIYFIPVAWIIGVVSSSLVLNIYLRRNVMVNYIDKVRIDINYCKNLITPCLSLLLSASALQISSYFDINILGILKSNVEVGLYSAANKIIFVVLPLGYSFGNAIFPIFSNIYKEKTSSNINFFINTWKVLLSISFIISVILFFRSEAIIGLIFGNEFMVSSKILRILAWRIIIIFFYIPLSFFLISTKREKIYMYGTFIAALSNIVMNLLLVPNFSYYGAAIATIISDFFVLIYFYLYLWKEIKFSIFKYFFKFLLSALMISFFLKFVNINIVLELIIILIIYSVSILIFKGISIKEIKQLIRIITTRNL